MRSYLGYDVGSPSHDKVGQEAAERHYEEHEREEVSSRHPVRGLLCLEYVCEKQSLAGEDGRYKTVRIIGISRAMEGLLEEDLPPATQVKRTMKYHHPNSGVRYAIFRTVRMKPRGLNKVWSSRSFKV